MLQICKETTDFVRACEAIHALLDTGGTLTTDDRDLIEFSGSELLSKLTQLGHSVVPCLSIIPIVFLLLLGGGEVVHQRRKHDCQRSRLLGSEAI